MNINRQIITPENYYKRDGVYTIEEQILNPNLKSTGFVNFNTNKYDWVYKLYTLMINSFWTTNEVNTSDEKKNYENLSDDEKEIYKTMFATLSFLDSSQEEYILDFRKHITNRNMKAMFTKQAETEVLHSDAYKVLLEKTGISDEVFELHRTNDVIANKAERVASQFAKYINEANKPKNLLYSAIGSANLEGIYFLTGFGMIYTLGDKVPGARDMIKFIQRDETCVHPDTELLTNLGWLTIDEIKQQNALIAQYDMDTEEITFDKPIRYIDKHYNGKMVKLLDQNGNIHQHITEDHDIVYKDNKIAKGAVGDIDLSNVELPIVKNDVVEYVKGSEFSKEIYDYDGRVVCVTMPKGTIITRYDGNVCVTGNCHLAIFANTIKSITREHKFTLSEIDNVYKEIEYGVETELEFARGILNGMNILGLDINVLEDTIKNYANHRLRAIGFDPIYELKDKTFLQELVDHNGQLNEKRENFFETNVTTYSKGTLDFDNF